MDIITIKFSLEFKGSSREIIESIPDVSRETDFFTQYVGIWRVFFEKVQELKAKSVVEFGTRDGYSTRLFSKALESTGGEITTIDINPPKTQFTEKNIKVVTGSVEDFTPTNCDILYIDDWHNEHHLYWELNQFAKLARVVMVHDVCLDHGLMLAISEWCRHNMVVYTIYPLNGCGLAVIEIEKSGEFYNQKGE
jgi:hypothetical protein